MSSLGKCVIDGAEAIALYPLLPGSPAFCAAHHDHEYAGKLYGVDFSSPDDFEIPAYEELFERVFKPPYDEKTKAWTDRTGRINRLTELSDSHLHNILRWMQRQALIADRTIGVEAVEKAVREELLTRGGAL